MKPFLIGLVATVTIGCLTMSTVLTSHADDPETAKATAAPTASYKGRLLGPDGKAVTGRVFRITGGFWSKSPGTEIPVDGDGNFAFDAPAASKGAMVVGISPDLAIGGTMLRPDGAPAVLSLGKPRTITSAEGPIIRTIDRKPAVSIYEEYLKDEAQNQEVRKIGQKELKTP